ncbi:MAG: hypothetical protein ACOC2K_04050, partial [Bacteroidota bacterium]
GLSGEIYERLLIPQAFEIKPDKKKLQDRSLQKFLENKGIAREDLALFLNPADIAAEAFALDLIMNLNIISEAGDKPVNLFLIADNIDEKSGAFNSWLEKCLQVFNSSPAGLRYYTAVEPPDKAKLFNYEYNIILSSRFKKIVQNFAEFSKEYDFAFKEFNLEPLSAEKTKKLLFFEGYKIKDDKIPLHEHTGGLPYIALKYAGFLGETGRIDIRDITLASYGEYLLKPFGEELKQFICFAAFLDCFDHKAYLLQKPQSIDPDKLSALMNRLPEIFIPGRDGLYGMSSLHSSSLKEYIKESNPALFDQFTAKAKAYNSLDRSILALSENDFKILRNIAYFVFFDQDYALPNVFRDDYQQVEDVLIRYPELFVKKNTGYSLVPDLRANFIELNRMIDGEKFSAKTNLVAGAWSSRKELTEGRLKKYRAGINKYRNEISIIEKSVNDKHLALEEAVKTVHKFIDETRSIKQKIQMLDKINTLPKAVLYFTAAATALLLTMLIAGTTGTAWAGIIELAGYASTGILFAVSIVHFFNAIKYYRIKNVLDKYKAGLNSSKHKLAKAKEKKRELKNDIQAGLDKIEQMKKEINRLNDKISYNELILEETYI